MTRLPLFFSFLSLVTCLRFLFAAAAPLSSDGSPEQDGTGQTSIQDASLPFAGINETDGTMLGVYYCTAPFWNALPSVDAACAYSSSSWSSSDTEGDSTAAVVVSDPCISLRGTTAAAQGKPQTTWYRNVASFAPDEGVVCVVYEYSFPRLPPFCYSSGRLTDTRTSGDKCTGASLRIANPGFPDLGVVGWARRVASYACVGASTDEEGDDDDAGKTAQGGSWFLGDGD
ncbi:hypothetical protein IWX90DRAFT_411561 [Phyllosticta citrichinensis]|uniref:Uncharacterized protein n=1 Tax=Phyllosticta citrichinensis TaxID=1130410 RepID=A0ABR1Y9D8_9PEZI